MQLLTRYQTKYEVEAGVDEAGRGALAGPVVAAAVILPPDFYHPDIQDSKRLKPETRLALRSVILENCISWGIGIVSVACIDQVNIINATRLAMQEAVQLLPISPEFIIIDGKNINLFPQTEYNTAYIIKGDQKYLSIAAASILAKTYRDELMTQLDKTFPIYQWADNKGYPTLHHRKTILTMGASHWHRKTFSVRL